MKKIILLVWLSLTLVAYNQAQTGQKKCTVVVEDELLSKTTLQDGLESELAPTELSLLNRQLQSEGNVLNLLQNGSYNSANVITTKNANTLNVLQEGFENSINYQSIGEDVYSSILQKGNNNNVEQALSCNDLSYKIEQYGDKNNLKIVEDGSGLSNLIIRQWSGSNLEIVKGMIYK
ncbi:MAG: hypothetical protein Q8862_05890 [Bacteroidota bacterium]|nr:hypothetical protein [Bacteroidota bacterium]MDP4206595.1 hypothetical protein [Bacteroidota bacterium]